MEKDFPVFEPETIEKIKHFKIPYKWRDSCVNDLIELRICEENNNFLKFFKCSGFKSIWENCQFAREREIISSEVFQVVPEEKRRLSF
jgi:hypothetical protein